MTFTTKSLTAIALVSGLAATSAGAQEATFAMVDADADGYLTEAELTNAFGEAGLTLLRYDLDADGQLTPQEIQARNEDRAEAGEDVVPSNVDRVLENSQIGDGADDEDVVEEDEFGATARAGGDVQADDDNGDDEFGNLEAEAGASVEADAELNAED